MSGEHDCLTALPERSQDRFEDRAIVDVRRAVDGREDVFSWRETQSGSDVPLARLLRAREGDIIHYVPDKVDPPFDPFPCEVINRGLRRTEEQGRKMVRDNPVQLLRHLSIEAPQARLDMAHGAVELRRGQSARQR